MHCLGLWEMALVVYMSGRQGIPVLPHEVAGQEQLVAGDVLDGDVVEESDEANEGSHEERHEPFEDLVLEDLDPPPRPPVLLVQVVLHNPEIDPQISTEFRTNF